MVKKGVKMTVREFLRSKRRLVGAAVVCVVLVAGLAVLWQVLWQGGQFAEAAILDPHLGLVGWWRFDDGVGVVAGDSSGSGNDGTVYGGAAWVDGKHGKALSFDGTNDYVDCGQPDSLKITSSITVEAWINLQGAEDGGIGRWKTSSHESSSYLLHFSGSKKFQFFIEQNTNYDSSGQSSAVDLNTWHHMVGVYDNDTKFLGVYVDGELASNKTTTLTGINTGTRDFYIGRFHTVYGRCIIDEVRVYNRVLSASEIQEIFQKGPDFSSRLLAKVPKGTTQFVVTLSWQGVGSINVTIESSSKNYTEDMVPVYQRTVYSSSSGDMLNIKRLAVSVIALSSDENWYVVLEFEDVEDYRITVEVQR